MSAPLGPEVAEARDLHLAEHHHSNFHHPNEQHDIPTGRTTATSNNKISTSTDNTTTGLTTGIADKSPAETLVDAGLSEDERPKGAKFFAIIREFGQFNPQYLSIHFYLYMFANYALVILYITIPHLSLSRMISDSKLKMEKKLDAETCRSPPKLNPPCSPLFSMTPSTFFVFCPKCNARRYGCRITPSVGRSDDGWGKFELTRHIYAHKYHICINDDKCTLSLMCLE